MDKNKKEFGKLLHLLSPLLFKFHLHKRLVRDYSFLMVKSWVCLFHVLAADEDNMVKIDWFCTTINLTRHACIEYYIYGNNGMPYK